MSEYFIVLSHEPTRHESLGDAQAEQHTLAKHFPEKTFTVHRCKRWLFGAKHFTKMVDLLGDIARDGFTEANQERARILLLTIGNRTPRLRISPNAPPEFEPRRAGGGT